MKIVFNSDITQWLQISKSEQGVNILFKKTIFTPLYHSLLPGKNTTLNCSHEHSENATFFSTLRAWERVSALASKGQNEHKNFQLMCFLHKNTSRSCSCKVKTDVALLKHTRQKWWQAEMLIFPSLPQPKQKESQPLQKQHLV